MASEAANVIRACRRLKKLQVSGRTNVDLQVQAGPDLAGELIPCQRRSRVHTSCPLLLRRAQEPGDIEVHLRNATVALACFRLQALAPQRRHSAYHDCTLPLWTIPSFLFQRSIANLNLDFERFSTSSDISTLYLPSLIRLAPHLTTLRLILFSPIHLPIPAPFLHHCTSLRHLTSNCLEVLAGVSGTLAPLESWHHYSARLDLTSTLRLLRGMPAGHLKRMRFMMTRGEAQLVEGFEDLAEELRRRGAEMVLRQEEV